MYRLVGKYEGKIVKFCAAYSQSTSILDILLTNRSEVMHMRGCSLFLSLLLLLTPLALGEQAEGVWMLAVSAGKADCILLGVEGWTCMIDTGHARSMGKVKALMDLMGVDHLDAVFVTHTDSDHIGGLDWLADSDIPIGAWYASAMYTDIKSEKKHPMVKAAKKRGESVTFLRAGDSVTLPNATLTVLAPIQLNENDEDDNSLVMMLDTAQGSMLLTGDMEGVEEAQLLSSGQYLKCDVLKVPNHADDDACSESFVDAVQPKLAVICTDTAEKPETPDPRVLASLATAGAETYVTQEATGGILVRLEGGVPSARALELEAPQAQVQITDVIPGDDLIELHNPGEALALDGWYLWSSRGGELFPFPEGTVIGTGASLTVGTNTTKEGSYDLLWDDKKVVHRSKEDVLWLYAPNGMPVSSLSNGL